MNDPRALVYSDIHGMRSALPYTFQLAGPCTVISHPRWDTKVIFEANRKFLIPSLSVILLPCLPTRLKTFYVHCLNANQKQMKKMPTDKMTLFRATLIQLKLFAYANGDREINKFLSCCGSINGSPC